MFECVDYFGDGVGVLLNMKLLFEVVVGIVGCGGNVGLCLIKVGDFFL